MHLWKVIVVHEDFQGQTATAFALKELNAAEEAKISEIVTQAVS